MCIILYVFDIEKQLDNLMKAFLCYVLSEVEEAGLIMAAVQSTVKTESVSYDVTSCMPSSPCTSATCNMDILQPMAGKNGLFYVFKRNVE